MKGARHPFLEMMDVEVVPNDILADPDHRIIVLTGDRYRYSDEHWFKKLVFLNQILIKF